MAQKNLSTLDLTRRSTRICKRRILSPINLSTHDLARRSTGLDFSGKNFFDLSALDLTRRSIWLRIIIT
ncbi:MAG TPA: hypothetical protein H9852_08960 [Candidatus Mediterraneibacter colneyensis]|nr:hypothetical protein [Candidatus Mediterraneibacter colneyensis]